MAKQDLTLTIKADVKKATAEIKNINKTLEQFKKEQKQIQKELLKSAKSVSNFTDHLTKIAQVAVIAEGLKELVSVGMEFETSMKKLGAISKATANDMQRMESKARELGASTQYSASQVAEAMNYEAMAGMKANQILEATPAILNLATVGQMDLARASDIATDTMTAFGLKATDLKGIVDKMSVTITSSNTNVEQLGEAFKNVAPVAHNLGLNISQTSALLGVLADAGKKGGEAGTHLKIILQRLASTTKPVMNGFRKLGISAYDSNGKLLPMIETLKKIKSKLNGMSDVKRNTILKDLFGEEAISSANIILNNLDSYDKKLNKISNSAGKASIMADKMKDTLAGDWKTLKSAVSELAITIYQDLEPALRDTLKAITNGTKSITEFYHENEALVKTLAEVGLAVYAVRKAYLAYLAVEAMVASGAVITRLNQIRTALIALASANPIILALSVALGAIIYKINEMEEATQKLNKSVEALNSQREDTSKFFDDLYSHMEKGTRTLKLNNNELDSYKTRVKELIKSNEERLKQIKKLSDGSDRYKEEIYQLNEQHKLLEKTLKKLEHTKPIANSKTINDTNKQTQAVKVLTKEQKQYLKSLDNEAKKVSNNKKTLDEWYQYNKNKLHTILGENKAYYDKLNELNTIYISKLKTSYNKRIQDHTNTVNKLEAKEKSLANKILQINKDLQNKLKQIERERLNTLESIDNKIHGIQVSELSSYKQYVDKKKQAEIRLSKAKEALKNKDLAQAKRYMTQYQSIVESIAGTEIKENGRVVVSKKQSDRIAINGLKNLKGLTNQFYAEKKAKEIADHNRKIQQLKVELQATKAQLQLEVQRLNLEKQMIQLLTGKKVDIDTSEALNSIKSLDTQIKQLDNQIKKPSKIDVDNSKAKQKTEEIKKNINDVSEKKIVLKADTRPTEQDIEAMKRAVENFDKKFPIDADDTKAKQKINELKKPTSSMHDIKLPNINEALKRINSLNNKNTHSTHTIYIREVHKKATGGIIPLRRATGGGTDVNFERKSGRIAGYDPTDSDDVPALLTRGEFVIKREAVSHYGDDFLYKLNNKMLPKYATGGIVEANNPAKKMISQIDNTQSEINSSDKNIDLSKLDELIDTLKELQDKFKIGGVNSKSIEIERIIKEIQSEKNSSKSIIKHFNNDDKKSTDFKNSLKGKTLSESEFKNFENKSKSYDNKLKEDSKKIDREKKAVNNLVQKVNNEIRSLKNYLQRVDNIKSKIQNKLSEFGLDENNFSGLNESLDLGKLQNFYSKLSHLKNLTPETINSKFNNISSEWVKSARSVYYSTIGTGFSGDMLQMMMPRKPNGNVMLDSFGIKDRELENRYTNLFNTLSYRTFGGNSTKLGDEIIQKTIKDYLYKNLPKFQTGGINGLNGGKLNGYGGGDRNLALLEDGEFIVRKEAVKHFGTDFLHNVNNIKLPKFQVGGLVDFNNLPKFQDGGEFNQNVVGNMSVDFNLPSGNKYSMMTSEEVAKKFSEELKRIM